MILPALLAIALVVTAIGWWRAESDAFGVNNGRFEACRLEESTLVLEWTSGAGQVVSPRVDARSAGRVVVSLELRQEPGDYPAIGLPGTPRLAVYGGPMEVTDPNGDVVVCPQSS